MRVLIHSDVVISEIPDSISSVAAALRYMGYDIDCERDCKMGYARGIKCFGQQVTKLGTVYYFDRWNTWLGKVIPV